MLVAKDAGHEERMKGLGAYGIPTKAADGLPCDFAWFAHAKRFGIELKVGNDLPSSMVSKGSSKAPRLVAQARKMTEQLDYGIILISAHIDDGYGKLVVNDHETGWDYRSIMGALARLMPLGLFVERWDVRGYESTTERIAYWYKQTTSDDNGQWLRSRSRPEVLSLYPQHTNDVWALAAYDQVGVGLAEALLEAYGGTLFGVLMAAKKAKDAKAFAKNVKGLGEKKASALMEAWGCV
jgi:ERCC4-type nuclease